MPIEIKELHIKVTITETDDTERQVGQKISPTFSAELKSEIIKECTKRVLEKIKEKTER